MSDLNAANIPGASPLVDENGRITMVWYQFLLALFNRTGGTGTPTDITALQQQVIAQDLEINTAVPVQPKPVSISECITPVQRPLQPDFSQQMVYQPPGQYAVQNTAVSFSTIKATGAITPSQTAGIVGTTTNNNASIGAVGEYLTLPASGVSMTNGTQTNVVSLPLSAGDWEVSGNISFIPTGVLTGLQSSCNSVSATIDNNSRQILQVSFLNAAAQQIASPTTRISLASAGNAYLVGIATFSSGTVSASGTIRARRVR